MFPMPWRTGPNTFEPAEIVTTFVPALRMRSSIDDWAPCPMATMTITAATPMIMPSAVSAVRMALRRRAVTAMDNVMAGDMVGSLCRELLAPGVVLAKLVRRITALLHGPIEPHTPVAETDDARRVLGDVGLVGHEHDRDALFGVQPLEDPHYLDAGPRVEIARGLVREEQRRIVHERARDGDALLLTARQLIRMVIEPRAESYGFERRRGATMALLRRHGRAVEHRELHFSIALVRASRLNP